MPVTYRIDNTRGIIYTRCAGNATFAEVLDHFKVLVRDPGCPARLDVLLDLTETASIPETHQLRAVSDQIGILHQKVSFGACVIVASREVLYGMSRMFEAIAGKWFQEIQVCRTLEEAETWLDSRSTLAGRQSSGSA
jgi:hypothetical protein